MRPLAVYVHIPFCAKKCAYCDFASFSGQESRWDAYFNALAGEIADWSGALKSRRIESVFFGGGTPSLVPAERIAEVLSRLRAAAAFSPDAEITLEANPGTLSMQKLAAYRAAGINRLSIGVQSFDAQRLRALGRIHTPEMAVDAVRMARAAGFENVSIDLMYGLPGQTIENWMESVERAIALPLRHVSAYSLIVEAGTPLAAAVEAGRVQIPEDDAVIEMQRRATERLSEAGFARYEISNYARPGSESRHNLSYWLGGDYLGLGSAAHSLMDGARFANPPEIERYIAGERKLDYFVRTLRDRREEALMLETRTARGLSLENWRAAFGEDFCAAHEAALRRLEAGGLIAIRDGFLRLTRAGMELQDSVVLELMDD